MEKYLLKVSSLILIFSLVACQAADLEEVVGIDSNTIVRGSFDQYDAAKISGSGAFRFDRIATEIRSALTVQGSLDQIQTGSLALHFYSASAPLASNSGVIVRFQRTGASVDGTIFVNGASHTISSQRLLYYYPASLDLIVEVHTSPRTRVLVWRRDVGVYTADTADVDSNRSGDVTGTLGSTGSGLFLGISLNLSTVSSAKVSQPQVL